MSPLKSRTSQRRQAPVVATLEQLKRANPDPRCELYYETPYQLLVSVILSAQATDKQVNKCMAPLYRAGFGINDVLDHNEAALLSKIRTIGLAPTKAKNIMRMSQLLRERHADAVPATRAELEALPGVGRKTANVILGELYRQPTLAVDTHVFRVAYRLGWHREKTPEKAERKLLQLVPESYLPTAHHWLILLGRYICKAARPDCPHCPVNHLCPKIGVKTVATPAKARAAK